MGAQDTATKPKKPPKKPFVVKLDEDHRKRLDYIVEQTTIPGAVLMRMLINSVSGGGFSAPGFNVEFPPYPGEQKG